MQSGLRHPHRRALVPIAGLAGFSLLTTMAIWGLSLADLVNPALTWVGFVFFVFFALILSTIWLMGLIQVQRAKAFLESDRPLIRWTYSTAEWQQMRETIWQEEKGDWKVQFGCLTFLFALTGLLTGVLLGLDGYFINIATNGLIGLAFGSLAGSSIGILVAGGNYLGARQAYGRSEPGQVALGVNEIYANDAYFRGNGTSSYILEAEIHRGNPTTLKFQLLYPVRPRMPRQEEWIIPLPEQWVEKVGEILPLLTPEN